MTAPAPLASGGRQASRPFSAVSFECSLSAAPCTDCQAGTATRWLAQHGVASRCISLLIRVQGGRHEGGCTRHTPPSYPSSPCAGRRWSWPCRSLRAGSRGGLPGAARWPCAGPGASRGTGARVAPAATGRAVSLKARVPNVASPPGSSMRSVDHETTPTAVADPLGLLPATRARAAPSPCPTCKPSAI